MEADFVKLSKENILLHVVPKDGEYLLLPSLLNMRIGMTIEFESRNGLRKTKIKSIELGGRGRVAVEIED